jgi:hypothetical protein
MAERDDHDQGVVRAVLSEHATVARFEGDTEREFHHYIDADIHQSAERYYEQKLEEMRARIKALRGWIEDEAADRGEADAKYEVHRQCAFALSEL